MLLRLLQQVMRRHRLATAHHLLLDLLHDVVALLLIHLHHVVGIVRLLVEVHARARRVTGIARWWLLLERLLHHAAHLRWMHLSLQLLLLQPLLLLLLLLPIGR